MLEFFDDQWLRWINLVLSFLALVFITANMTARREKINRRTRRIMFWIYGLFLYTAYETGSNIQDGLPIRNVTYFLFIVLSGIVISVLWRPPGDDDFPPDDGSIGQLVLDRLDDAFAFLRQRYKFLKIND